MKILSIPLLLTALLVGCWLNSVENQAQKLGSREFTREAWAKASRMQRAEMTASFLKKYETTHFTRQEVEDLLGPPTAYYDYDSNVAYVVGPETVQNMYGNGYLWVFEADKDDGQIDNVFFVPEVR